MHARTGLFITLEGLDGSGKTTAARTLVGYLRTRFPVVHTREPGGTLLNEHFRALLLHEPGSIDPRAEVLLLAAMRVQLLSDVIRPALRAGTIVICERYLDSSLAYQGYGHEFGADYVRAINALAAGIMPDLTLLLDIDPATALARIGARGGADSGDTRPATFLQRAREGFLTIAAREPHRVRVLDATRPAGVVSADIHRITDAFLRTLDVSSPLETTGATAPASARARAAGKPTT